MRHRVLAACAGIALLMAPIAVSAQGIEIGPGGVRIDDGRGRERGRERGSDREICRELRQACMHKEELGERGQGNCREYREQCQ
jgi:hypothetical protein